ncbi:single-stranded DNA-binding protein [Intrasporangium calvum]|uniref:single-stranded DNA-binding protein n=1 Tax=Intrasporangium calvum TaxID=53358 RepID=UPI000DF62AF9|nr:single-stranded DNA-binding protein [Intrasporangium calvum]AXG13320.1 single-stranded DNA-binding protein [Intrasporangium calvum]
MARQHRAATPGETGPEAGRPGPGRNEVALSGRLSAAAEERVLPSGDTLVTLRIVVPRAEATTRAGGRTGERRPGQVDTIDVVCWSARTRRTALRLEPGAGIDVEGSLRRRFFATPGGRQSRYEVEARTLRRAHGTSANDT